MEGERLIDDGNAYPTTISPAVAVDLFFGAGGASYVMQKAGIMICGEIDIEPVCLGPLSLRLGRKPAALMTLVGQR